jgi:hypothetical protein
MVTFLITSVLVFGLIAIAIYFWQKPANRTETIELPPKPENIRGLFSDTAPEPQQIPATNDNAEVPRSTQSNRNAHKELAEALIESFQETVDRDSTVELLHMAALSDDAETYCRAVETAMRAWREQKIRDLSPTELQALFTSQFWVLSSGTRSSGAGFVLKRTLSSAQHELETTNHNRPTVD